ncbi:HET-domain-containing protein [Ophiobolus disseminans]|uniref:HET-domain-containing protein n=1 Tax=Ophiobolus disseminans TaxID=1469910 RepID=A0A6A6ZS38_9PLEO|nr:HET-domain-containing protein [Ophiobolus disseminans]
MRHQLQNVPRPDTMIARTQFLLFPDSKILRSPPLIYQSPSDDTGNLGMNGWGIMEFFPVAISKFGPLINVRSRGHKRDNPLLSCSVRPEVPQLTDDEFCFVQVKNWLRTCAQTHSSCGKARSGLSEWLPTRLIDVREKPRLIITGSTIIESNEAWYVNLSYRWLQGSSMVLRRSNMDDLQKEIPLSQLTPVFRDSIYAARRLGCRYIWIDALCIIQDNPEDWAVEASRMGLVYQAAYCNFGASAASHHSLDEAGTKSSVGPQRTSKDGGPSVGLFVSRICDKNSMVSISVVRKHYHRRYFGIHKDLRPNLTRDSLMGRGRIFQERLTSVRSIYFGDQTTWECPSLLANESFPGGLDDFTELLSLPMLWDPEHPQCLINLLQQHRPYAELSVRAPEIHQA